VENAALPGALLELVPCHLRRISRCRKAACSRPVEESLQGLHGANSATRVPTKRTWCACNCLKDRHLKRGTDVFSGLAREKLCHFCEGCPTAGGGIARVNGLGSYRQQGNREARVKRRPPPPCEKIWWGRSPHSGPQVDGLNQRFGNTGPHPRPKNPKCPLPRFFPHELARSPKRRVRTEGLAVAGRFGAVHPGTQVSADGALEQLRCQPASLHRSTDDPAFSIALLQSRRRQWRACPRLVQAVALPVHHWWV